MAAVGSPVSIQTQSLALRALCVLRLDGNRAKRKPLRLARFPSKRNARNERNASDCVWMETGPKEDDEQNDNTAKSY